MTAGGTVRWLRTEELKMARTSRDGKKMRALCPDCSAQREHHRLQRCLAADLAKGVAYCHHCGHWFLIEGIAPRSKDGKPQELLPREVDLSALGTDFTEAAAAFFAARAIPMEVVRRAGVMCCRRYDTESRREETFLAFPSWVGGRCVNVHYRSLSKHFQQEPGCPPVPWNLNACVGQRSVVVTEGRMDALAMMTAGVEAVLSLGNGAGSRLELLSQYEGTMLADAEELVVATDADEAGRKAADALCSWFGRARCRVVQWPDGVKDANEVLVKLGPAALRRLVDEAGTKALEALVPEADWSAGLLEYWQMGGVPQGLPINLKHFAALEKLEPGYLGVTTAYAGNGKSTFQQFKALSMAVFHGWRTVFYTPEKYPYKLFYHELAEMLLGRHLGPASVSRAHMEEAMHFLASHIFVVEPDISHRGVDDLTETFSAVARRKGGVQMVVVDPVNFVDTARSPGNDAVERLNYVAVRLADYAKQQNVVCWAVAHPRKPFQGARDYVPEMHDISGTSMFGNAAAWVEVMQRVKETEAADSRLVDVWLKKVRFGHLGRVGRCCLEMSDVHRFQTVEEYYDTGGRRIGFHPEPADRTDWIELVRSEGKLANG